MSLRTPKRQQALSSCETNLFSTNGESKVLTGSKSTVTTESSSLENNSLQLPADDRTEHSPELTESKLHKALEDANQRNATANAELAKSDAVILELRSYIRQLKRQVEQVQKEKEAKEEMGQKLKVDVEESASETRERCMREEIQKEGEKLKQLDDSKLQVDEHPKDQILGELQVQLDRAHAQILTANVVRKELEDTLEAEQYTWELRVQDQERQIIFLHQECKKLKEDLEECRLQCREAESGWSEEITTIKNQLGHKDENLHGKLRTLEKEREELQRCLDEAMKELEAVDQELRQNSSTSGPLQHLHHWVLERSERGEEEIPVDANLLVQSIKDTIEATPDHLVRVAELETQLSVFRGDLIAREQSSAELRASLKEAVALLKPLQDAVAKADNEKKELEIKLRSLQKLHEHERIPSMVNPAYSSPPTLQMVQSIESPVRTMPSGEEQQERSARDKRDNAQIKLQRMLSDAHTRFEGIQKNNFSMIDENETLRTTVQRLEKELEDAKPMKEEHNPKRNMASEIREAAIEQLEQDVKGYSQQLSRKEKEFRELEQELRLAREKANNISNKHHDLELQVEKMKQEIIQKDEMEQELMGLKKNLSSKTKDERLLKLSLQEALSLVKPLQTHLHTAIQEKKVLKKELKHLTLSKTFDRSLDFSQSAASDERTTDFEGIISRSEQENPNFRRNQSKLEEKLVEMKSRTRVTEEKLTSATSENEELSNYIREKEQLEQEMLEELLILRKKLQKSEQELDNAKYIATSALVKVEELTMAKMSDEIVGNKGNGKNQNNPAVIQRLNNGLISIQKDVVSANELNETREESIQERDRTLERMVEEHGSSPSTTYSGGSQNLPSNAAHRQKGVSWVN
mmetsp:Transcript_643/g.768  ORF Transcript_643/g.768 Transcript_643/m.768 type:complete len:866 (-) Transcript_643:82-2679(-)